MNRILFSAEEWSAGEVLRLGGARARHVREVLRAEPGAVLKLGLLNGPRMRGRVLGWEGETVVLALEAGEVPPRPPVDVLLALPRPKVLRRLLPQLVAMGVGRLYLTNAARVERNYFDTHVLSEAALREACVEGLTQAGDTLLPEIRVVRALRPFVEDELGGLTAGMGRVLFHPQAAGEGWPPSQGRVLAAFGPEGGWVPFELELFAAAGFAAVSLSPRILRTDTAVIGAMALLGRWVSGA